MRRNAPVFQGERCQLFSDEADFQAQLVSAAKRLGWRVFHDYDSRRSEPGFPDLVLASRTQRRVIFAELKTGSGQLSEEQAWWAVTLSAAGIEYYLWRYANWDLALRTLWKRPDGGSP
jgi:hypothetical protein